MIDIFCSGGAMCSIQMSFDTMERIMRDDFIKDDDFVPITFYDGVRGAVRKRYINFFANTQRLSKTRGYGLGVIFSPFWYPRR